MSDTPRLILADGQTTESQREIWSACQFGAEASLAYNLSFTLTLVGRLNVPAMARALHELVEWHAALRLVITNNGFNFRILPAHPELLRVVQADASEDLLADDQRRAVEEPFDLEAGPLVRMLLLVGTDRSHLLFTAHHLVCDGWSIGVLWRDLGTLYSAYAAGLEVPTASLLPPRQTFAAFAADHLAYQASAAATADLAYWQGQFAAGVPSMDLPHDLPRQRFRGFRSERIDRVLPTPLVKAIKELAAGENCSLFIAMLAAYQLLLAKTLGHDQVVTAIPAAGQAAHGRFDLVGNCINTLPIQSPPCADDSFTAYIAKLRKTVLDAYEHMHFTYGRILQHVAVPRDPSRMPLTPVLFNIDRQLYGKDGHFADLQATSAATPRLFEAFEIFQNISEAKGVYTIECQYATELYSAAWINSHIDAYIELLAAIVRDPHSPVARLHWAPLHHLERQYFEWNQRDQEITDDHILTLIDRMAAQFGSKVAVVGDDGELSYAQLQQLSNQWARYLKSAGVTHGAFVGVAVARSAMMLPVLLGIFKAGACYVPMDPSYPSERLKYMVEASGCPLVVCSQSVTDSLPQVPGCRLLVVEEILAQIGREDVTCPPLELAPADLAYVIFTSGSTGQPKGVQVPHGGIVNLLLSMQKEPGLSATDRLLAVTTLSFDISVVELFLPLITGATVIVCRREVAADGQALAAVIAEQAITILQATPSTWRLLIESGWQGAKLKAITGGEPLPAALAEALLPRIDSLWNVYGPTEATVWATCQQITPNAPITIGGPMHGVTVYVLDRFGLPVPWDMPGELYIGGAGVARGYLGRDDLTRERFVHIDGIPELSKVYRTGDLVRLKSSGVLEYIGRNDHQVKLRGYRIELGEIEAVCARHPDANSTVLVLREDQPGDQRLVTYVATSTGLSEAEMLAWCRQFLPAYMVPQHAVMLAQLPLLPNGKIDRKALPPPLIDAAGRSQDSTPKAGLEAQIAGVWQAVLGLEAIPADVSFYSLGGHSFLAVRMLAALNRELGLVVALRTLMEHPSVRALAAVLSTTQGEAQVPIPRLSDGRRARLSIIQERVYYLDQLNPGDTANLMVDGRMLRGPLATTALQAALQGFVDRQPLLRGRVVSDGAGPLLTVADDLVISLESEDLSLLTAAEQQARLEQGARALATTPVNVHEDRLFKFSLFKFGDEQHALLTMFHHLIWDGRSYDIFWTELNTLYLAASRGVSAELEPPAASYLDFALWHRQMSASAVYLGQLPFWRRYLADMEYLELPTDLPRPARRTSAGKCQEFVWDRRQVELLQRVAKAESTTPFIVMLTLLKSLLSAYTGQHDITVGTPVQGRGHTDLHNVIGYFVNTLVLRTQIDQAVPLRRLIAAVKASAEAAFANQDVAFEEILQALAAKPDPSRTSLFSVMFTYQDTTASSLDWAPLQVERLMLPQPTVGTDLVLWAINDGDGLKAGFSYRTDLFSDARIAAIIAHLTALLEQLGGPHEAAAAGACGNTPACLTAAPRAGSASLLRSIVANAARRAAEPFIVTAQGALSGDDYLLRTLEISTALARSHQPGTTVALANDGDMRWLLPTLTAAMHLGLSINLCRDTDAEQGWRWLPQVPNASTSDTSRRSCIATLLAVPATSPLAVALAGGEVELSDEVDGRLLEALKAAAHVTGSLKVSAHLKGPDQLRWALLALLSADRLLISPVEPRHSLGDRRTATDCRADALMMTGAQAANLLALGWTVPRNQLIMITDPCPAQGLMQALAPASQVYFLAANTRQGSWFAAAKRHDDTHPLRWQPLADELQVVDGIGKPVAPFIDGLIKAAGGGTPTWVGRIAAGHLQILGARQQDFCKDGFRQRRSDQLWQYRQFPAVLYAHASEHEHGINMLLLVNSGMRPGDASSFAASLDRSVPKYLSPTHVVLTDGLPLASCGQVSNAKAQASIKYNKQVDDEPRGLAERQLAAIWCQTLGVSRVGRTDNFFDLGGYSLLPLLVINQVQKATGVRLELGVFLTQSLAAIAAQCGFEAAVPAGAGQESDRSEETPAAAVGTPLPARLSARRALYRSLVRPLRRQRA